MNGELNSNKKISIIFTGATGYLGSHLLKKLYSDKFEFIIIKRSFSNCERIKEYMGKCIFYDIDKQDISEIFNKHEVDLIIHCATNYGRKETDPLHTVEANLILPLKLLELGRRYKIKAFINTDTILDKGVNNYSLSKSQFKEWLAEYSEELTCCNVALEHFYGPFDDDSKFVSNIISSFLDNKKEIDLTLGYQKRDFIYILDVVGAIELIVNKSLTLDKGFYSYQIGTGDALSIRNFVDLIKELTGNTKTKTNYGAIPYRINEVMDCNINNDSILELGWKCEYSLIRGLKLTIDLERKKRKT